VGEAMSGHARGRIAVSEAVRRELVRYYGLDAVVVPYGIDTERFAPGDRVASRRRLGLPEHARVGLFVGRWDVFKGADVLTALMARTPEIEWLLVLGGGVPDDRALRLPRVHVLVDVPYEEMPAVYAAADFMAFPSRYEGFGYAVIEAAACGVPVLAPPVGIAATLHAHRPLGDLALPPASAGAAGTAGTDRLVDAARAIIARLGGNAAWRAEVVAAGRSYVERHHTIARWEAEMARALGVA
jgi:glycosyltransferase involved in cell wall biosynthesis